MEHKNYWEKRSEQVLLEAERRTNSYLNQINVTYVNTSNSIDKEITKIFNTYKKDFSQEDARMWLNESIPQSEYERLKQSIHSITDEQYKKQALMQLNAPAYRYRITRLKQIQQTMSAELSKAADIQLQLSNQCYVDTLKHSYSKTMFDIQNGVGMAFDFAQLPQSTIKQLLNAKWEGRNFSESIWNNTQDVASKVSDIIKEGILAGQDIGQMSKALMEKTYTSSMMNATRLMRTEVNYFTNQGALESYKEAELDSYEFLATLDIKTSRVCGKLDSKQFPLEQAIVGENYPPMHPYCRSCAIPIIEADGLERMDARRARNPITGHNEVVEGMSYKDWKAKYEGKFDAMSSRRNIHFENKEIVATPKGELKLFQVANRKYNLWISEDVNIDAVTLFDRKMNMIQKYLPKDFVMPQKIIITHLSKAGYANPGKIVVGGYSRIDDTMYIDARFKTDKEILAFVRKEKGWFANQTSLAPYLHELGHKYHYTLVEHLAKTQRIDYNDAKGIFDREIKDFIQDNNSNVEFMLSRYAKESWKENNHPNEIIAEWFTIKDSKRTNKLIRFMNKYMKGE